MKAAFWLSALASALGAVSASDVFNLTSDNFDKFAADHPVFLAEFFAPWCGHCKSLAPHYEAAATELKEEAAFAKVDCTEDRELCEKFGVQGFPTLKVFRSGQEATPYTGPRTEEGLTSFMRKQLLPLLNAVTKENLDDFKDKDKVVVVAFFDEGSKDNETFSQAADVLRSKFTFGASNDAELAKSVGIDSLPGFVVFKKSDDEALTFPSDSEWDIETIGDFIINNGLPLISEIGPDTFEDLMARDKPLGYLFYNTKEERDEIEKWLKPIAKEVRDVLTVGFMNATTYGAHSGALNLEQKFPALAFFDTKNNKKYVFDQSKEFLGDVVSDWIRGVSLGNIARSIKSEAAPESQDEAVYVVVANTFNDIVNDTSKDVLVEYYAPWCGHCKALAPKYEALAQAFADDEESSDKVVIVKIDATANDVDFDLEGFPTIVLYPAGDKENPIVFSGQRTEPELAQFISEKGTHGVNIPNSLSGAPPKKEASNKSSQETASSDDNEPSSGDAEESVHDEL